MLCVLMKKRYKFEQKDHIATPSYSKTKSTKRWGSYHDFSKNNLNTHFYFWKLKIKVIKYTMNELLSHSPI
jgi:hypothetical protein